MPLVASAFLGQEFRERSWSGGGMRVWSTRCFLRNLTSICGCRREKGPPMSGAGPSPLLVRERAEAGSAAVGERSLSIREGDAHRRPGVCEGPEAPRRLPNTWEAGLLQEAPGGAGTASDPGGARAMRSCRALYTTENEAAPARKTGEEEAPFPARPGHRKRTLSFNTTGNRTPAGWKLLLREPDT